MSDQFPKHLDDYVFSCLMAWLHTPPEQIQLRQRLYEQYHSAREAAAACKETQKGVNTNS